MARKARGKPRSPDDYRMTFGEHLEELRTRMIHALIGVGVGAVLCWIFKDDLLGMLMRPVQVVLTEHGQRPQLSVLGPADAFIVALKLAGLTGLVIAAPWVLYQAWKFVGVGLYEHERRFVMMFLPASIVLFYVGVGFMLYVVLPIVINFFVTFSTNWPMSNLKPSPIEKLVLGIGDNTSAGTQPTSQPAAGTIPFRTRPPEKMKPGDMWFNPETNEMYVVKPDGPYVHVFRKRVGTSGVINQYSIKDYVTMILILSLAFGTAFQMPIVVVFLAITGIVSVSVMARARRFVYFGTIVLGAILTPPDVISQILLAIPMCALFEAGLLIGRFVTRQKTAGGAAG